MESQVTPIALLQDEFRNILLTHSTPIDSHLFASESDNGKENVELLKRTSMSYRYTNSIREIDLIPLDAIDDLRRLAEQIIKSGYSRECIQVYVSVRKSWMEDSFDKLEIENLGVENIQKVDWETLETKIRSWIRAANISIRMIFASEKKLCQQIFEGLGDSIEESCFMETIKDHVVQLFNFVEEVSMSVRDPEKLFKILDLYDCLSDLLPDIEIVFDSMSCESIRVQADEILSRLAEVVRLILFEFEDKVLCEPSKVPVPGGAIHPLTRYVMNYISLISDYKETLDELVVWKPSTAENADSVDIDFMKMENQTPLALHLIWLITILQLNLEDKTKYYKDASLSHLFMMNNVHYIVSKIKGLPELREMISDNYVRKLIGKFRSAATNYQRSTWVGVLHCLRDEGLHVKGGFSSGVSKTALKQRFKSFNAIFEEVHRLQATWYVSDRQLREELRISISELLIPAYRSFLGRFRGHIESGRHPENYIKYSVEDLETAVLDFFEGTPASQHQSRRSQ